MSIPVLLGTGFESSDDNRKTSFFESMSFISLIFALVRYIKNEYHGWHILNLYRLPNRHSPWATHIVFVKFELSHDFPKDLRLLHLRLMRHWIAIKKLFKTMHFI